MQPDYWGSRAYLNIALSSERLVHTFLVNSIDFSFQRILKSGQRRSVYWKINLPKIDNALNNFCTSLRLVGDLNSSSALIWAGFAPIPIMATIDPRNFLTLTLNTLSNGFSFIHAFEEEQKLSPNLVNGLFGRSS